MPPKMINKAGKAVGSGTTSLARKLRRQEAADVQARAAEWQEWRQAGWENWQGWQDWQGWHGWEEESEPAGDVTEEEEVEPEEEVVEMEVEEDEAQALISQSSSWRDASYLDSSFDETRAESHEPVPAGPCQRLEEPTSGTPEPCERPAVIPPWRAEKKARPATKPEIKYEEVSPWNLLTAPRDEASASLKTEMSSSSNSDDWGKQWKAPAVGVGGSSSSTHQRLSSNESFLMAGPLLSEAVATESDDPMAESLAKDIKGKLLPAVGVDWHNVIECRGVIDEASLQKLVDQGVEVSLLSWCFRKRAAEYKQLAGGLSVAQHLKRIAVTEKRTGPGGKVDLYTDWSIDVLFDDAEDICKEGFKAGMHVFPIKTWSQPHQWFVDAGFEPYDSLADAVSEFLKTYV